MDPEQPIYSHIGAFTKAGRAMNELFQVMTWGSPSPETWAARCELSLSKSRRRRRKARRDRFTWRALRSGMWLGVGYLLIRYGGVI